MVPRYTMLEDQPRWERRRYPRAPLHRRVDVHLTHWFEFQAWGHDVSRGGICLTMPTDVAQGERMTVGLTLSNELCLALDAEVSNVREAAGATVVGLRWLEADDEVLALLIEDLQ